MNDACRITVNAARPEGPMLHTWRYIGYDECNYTTMPEGKRLLARFGQLADAPYYVRTHFMFCSGNCYGTPKFGSTNIYREDADGNPIYDFTHYDRILDAIVESGNKPFVELGFMPQDLADPKYLDQPHLPWANLYQLNGWSSPPKDWNKWHDFITALAVHLNAQYGAEELATWYFELWNEPDIGYWQGGEQGYCTLYDYTEDALHDVLPNVRLSGPAVTGIFNAGGGRSLLQTFLRHCREGKNACTGHTGARLDFITFHVKGAQFPGGQPYAAKAVPSVGNMAHQVEQGLEIIAAEGFGDRHVVLSEADPDTWAAGNIADNANMRFRNSEYYASFVATAYDRIRKVGDRFGIEVSPLAWAFMFPQEECFAGTRTFTTQDIRKPVFNAFDLFSRLGSRRLAIEGGDVVNHALERELDDDYGIATPQHYTAEGAPTIISGIATAADNGSIQVLVYSHCDDIDTTGSREVEVRVAGLAASSYHIVHYRIDADHSNAHTVWMREGKPPYPHGTQYDTIRKAGEIEAIDERTEATTDGEITLQFDMPTHAISLLTFEEQ